MDLSKKIFIFVVSPILAALILIYNAHIASSYYTDLSKQVPVEYKAKMITQTDKIIANAGQMIVVKIRLVNEGSLVWNSSGTNPVNLSYHLFDESGKLLKFDNERFPIPGEIPYKYFVDISPQLKVPNKKGSYILEFDLVREGITWFSEKGSPTLKVILEVK
ncbi:hypothetical protein THYS13_00120 [Thermoanaerobacter sp. YS13]|uniref:hypothetical protein n=1 Tax=Thermoanaerobacter sp. YS13 TaxID=1511746 RepID=UPI0005739964|nr:hypothetical protein [Thermoanaerobacter sp. YS13]KHO61985.1 hypothetical protein THYS13_00120 [Thermoanaerobacter sp. YS13]